MIRVNYYYIVIIVKMGKLEILILYNSKMIIKTTQ
jgi:hypothetical protein